jgi:L-threonylcarbamoyladenylate synthase
VRNKLIKEPKNADPIYWINMNEQVEKSVEVLKAGGTILYPTDTIWGIGCDAKNEEAIQKIVELKGRNEGKSFILLADSFRMVEHYIPDFPEVVYDLVDLAVKPITIVYPNAQRLPASLLAEDGSIGIRITKDPFCCRVIQKMRGPIVSTSANLSGKPTGKKLSEIDQAVLSGVDYTVLWRESELLQGASQIIKISVDGSVKVLRK